MQSSPIFKGATRPPCVFGIPIKPFVLVVGLSLMICEFFFWFIFVAITLLIIMRQIAKYDDQRFDQMFLWLQVTLLCRHNGMFHAAPSSYKQRPSIRKHLRTKE